MRTTQSQRKINKMHHNSTLLKGKPISHYEIKYSSSATAAAMLRAVHETRISVAAVAHVFSVKRAMPAPTVSCDDWNWICKTQNIQHKYTVCN